MIENKSKISHSKAPNSQLQGYRSKKVFEDGQMTPADKLTVRIFRRKTTNNYSVRFQYLRFRQKRPKMREKGQPTPNLPLKMKTRKKLGKLYSYMLRQVRKQATLEITFYNESVVFEIVQTKNDTFTVENTATSNHQGTEICALQFSTIKCLYAKLQSVAMQTDGKNFQKLTQDGSTTKYLHKEAAESPKKRGIKSGGLELVGRRHVIVLQSEMNVLDFPARW